MTGGRVLEQLDRLAGQMGLQLDPWQQHVLSAVWGMPSTARPFLVARPRGYGDWTAAYSLALALLFSSEPHQLRPLPIDGAACHQRARRRTRRRNR